MRKAIGSEIAVFLKGNDGDVPNMYGMLVDVTEDSLYVQGNLGDKVYIIPRTNVYFCTTDLMPAADRVLTSSGSTTTIHAVNTPSPAPQPRNLSVFVNENLVVEMPIPPGFELNHWHDGIIQVVFGSPDVQAALAGKVQKEINYSPGEVYILVDDAVAPQVATTAGTNTFVMGHSGASPTTQFMNPTEMATRLSNSIKRGKKNGDSQG